LTYGDLRVDQSASGQEGQEPAVTVTGALTVRNTGTRAGSEVVQLYVRERAPRLQRPDKELKAFAKVALEPGEETEVRFTLSRRDLAVYDPRAGAWVITSPDFDLLAGASSRDIRAQASVTLAGVAAPTAPLGRLSPLRDWLAHPATRDRLRMVLDALRRQFFGGEADLPAAGAGSGDVVDSFVADMPIAKLVILGALSEGDLTHLIAAANAHHTDGAA